MDCRIFTDPSNGATYHDLLQSAELLKNSGTQVSFSPTTTCPSWATASLVRPMCGRRWLGSHAKLPAFDWAH